MESARSEELPTDADSTGVVRGCAVETPPLRSLLRVLDAPRAGWTAPTASVVAGGATATLSADGPERFAKLQTEAGELFDTLEISSSLPTGARPRLFGGFSFSHERADTHTDGETVLTRDSPWAGYPGAQFVLPAVQVSVTAEGSWLTTTGLGPDAAHTATERLEHWRDRIESLPEFDTAAGPGVTGQEHTPGLTEWQDRVESVIDRIQRGDLQKVVLAQSLVAHLETELNVVDVLSRLGQSYPSCYRFLFEPADGAAFFGATPERLIRLRGETVDTEALAGSIGRGETKQEDDWLEQELRTSEKNNHEHDLVVDAIRQQLTDVTATIETGERTVRKLSNVQHLQTPIRATLGEKRHVLELVERLHPTPAVGGLPLAEATRTIHELERFDRGWYAAPVGWFDEHGDGTFVVAIRSAVAAGNAARLFAGAGIVSDSDPDEEWDELQLKFRPILDELS